MRIPLTIIVAHPDDEVLYIGATLARFKAYLDLTIICATNYEDLARVEELELVCQDLDAKCIWLKTRGWFERYGDAEILSELARVRIEQYPAIITHSSLGELNQSYDHIILNKSVKKHLKGCDWEGLLCSFGIGTKQDVLFPVSSASQEAKLKLLHRHKSQVWYLENVLKFGLQNLESLQIEEL